MKRTLVLLVILLFSNLCNSQRAKKVFVHYLPWFDSSGLQFTARSGWCYPAGGDDCSDLNIIHYSNKPLIGEYSLFDEHVLEYHLLLIFATGIDGLIININPASGIQKAASLAVLDRIIALQALDYRFSLKIMVSYDDGGTASNSNILDYITWVYTNIYDNPTYSSLVFRDDILDIPVLAIWSESNNQLYWDTARSLFSDNVFLLVRNPVNFDFSDGNFEWVNYLNTGLPKSNTQNWGEQLFEDMLWRMARQSTITPIVSTVNTVKMGMVYPGFDDRNVPSFWNGGTNRYILRTVDSGSTLTNTWTKNIDFSPFRLGGYDEIENPWIQIITWNDWPEGTSIEPATNDTYGYDALKECQRKIGAFKGKGEDWIAESVLASPYMIYTWRLSGSNLNADLLVDSLINSVCSKLQCASPSVSPSSSPSASTSPSSSLSISPSVSGTPSVTASVSTSVVPSLIPTKSPSISPSSSSSPSVTSSVSTSVTPTISPGASSSSSPSVTPNVSTSVTPSLSPRVSASSSPSISVSTSIDPSVSTSIAPTVSSGANSSISPSPSAISSTSSTPSRTPTGNPLVTSSPGYHSSVSVTPSLTATVSPSITPFHTDVSTIAPSVTPSLSDFPKITPSKSSRASISSSISPSPSQSLSPSPSSSSSISPTPSVTGSPTPSLSPRPNVLRCTCECENITENELTEFKARCESLLETIDSSYANLFENSILSLAKEYFEEHRKACVSIEKLCSAIPTGPIPEARRR